jgi:hypothetical protein
MNCFTTYCSCANFGNLQISEVPRDFGTRFAVATGKTTNNPNNNLIFKQVGAERERERERVYQAVTSYHQKRRTDYRKKRTDRDISPSDKDIYTANQSLLLIRRGAQTQIYTLHRYTYLAYYAKTL